MTIMNIQSIYTETLSIAKLLHGEEADKTMEFAIERAEEFYKEHGVSPFIKSDKYDLYMVDYGWIVGRMADYFALSIADESDEETVNYLRMRINDDFRIGSAYQNIKLLVHLLEFKGILYNGGSNKFAYHLLRYESNITGKEFLFSAVRLNGKWVKNMPQYLVDILEKIGDNSQYITKSFGKNVFNPELIKNPNIPIIQFD